MTKKSPYIQQFSEEWLIDDEFKDWIQKVPTDKTKAGCRYCQCLLTYFQVFRTERSFQIRKAFESAKQFSCAKQSKLNFQPKVPSFTTARAEAGMTLFVTMHCAIQCVDHLTELNKRSFQLGLSDLKMHRTKCSVCVHTSKNY